MSQVAILFEDISRNLTYKIIENNGEYLIGYSGHFQLSKILYLNVSIFQVRIGLQLHFTYIKYKYGEAILLSGYLGSNSMTLTVVTFVHFKWYRCQSHKYLLHV